MITPSIYEIKQNTHATSPYFFSPKTLKFFGQTMKSFRVEKSPSGRIFIWASSRWDGQLMGYTFREYVDYNLKQISEVDSKDLNAIMEYIRSH